MSAYELMEEYFLLLEAASLIIMVRSLPSVPEYRLRVSVHPL